MKWVLCQRGVLDSELVAGGGGGGLMLVQGKNSWACCGEWGFTPADAELCNLRRRHSTWWVGGVQRSVRASGFMEASVYRLVLYRGA